MNPVDALRDIANWRRTLGLLPVPLERGEATRFVLLNGQSGNLCLGFDEPSDAISLCSNAWSANVGHYVNLEGDHVGVYRWDTPERSERYTASSVLKNLSRFHEHLERDTPNAESSIIKHALSVFRELRSCVRDGDEDTGFNALKAFLYLVASTTEDVPRAQLEIARWGLPEEARTVAASVNDSDWKALEARLSGVSNRGLTPMLPLLLRHASGSLFQEAHFQATVSLQHWLPGFGPMPASVTSRVSSSGTFFTPQAIARTLAEEAISAARPLSTEAVTIFDPACGSGELLKEVLRILELEKYLGQIRLIGWDNSPAAIDMARFALTWEIRSWTGMAPTLDLAIRDSVTAPNWPTGVDIVIMNPPFKSWQLMTDEEQESAATLLGSLKKNKPNMAHLFAMRAVGAVKDGGVMATVAPSSFFDSGSAEPIRRRIATSFSPVVLAKLGNPNLFFNAMVDAGLYVGVKEQTSSPATAMWADHKPTSAAGGMRALRRRHTGPLLPIVDQGFSVFLDPQLGRSAEGWAPKPFDAWQVYQRVIASGRHVLASRIFEINQGARLGSDAFVVAREYWAALPVGERAYFRPAVVNESIREGRLDDAFYVFFPHGVGRELQTEAELLERLPNYYAAKLAPERGKLQRRRSIGAAEKWWVLSRHRGWQIEPHPKLVSKYFGEAGSFAWDEKGEFVVVVGNAWTPRRSAAVRSDDGHQYGYLAYLNSPLVDSLLPYLSVSVGGGQWDLSNKYLDKLPLPDFRAVPSDILKSLISAGQKIAEGETIDRGILQQLCEEAFFRVWA